MKIYIASASSNISLVEHWRDELAKHHIDLTFDWTKEVRSYGPNPRDATPFMRVAWAETDVRAVGEADYLWMLMPGSFGSGVEFGVAFTCGIPRIVSGDWKSSIFTASASCFDSHEEAFKWIVESGVRKNQVNDLLSESYKATNDLSMALSRLARTVPSREIAKHVVAFLRALPKDVAERVWTELSGDEDGRKGGACDDEDRPMRQMHHNRPMDEDISDRAANAIHGLNHAGLKIRAYEAVSAIDAMILARLDQCKVR